jgi:hypothetical protein
MRRLLFVLLIAALSSGCIVSVGDKKKEPISSTAPSWEYRHDRVCVSSHLPPLEHDAQLVSILDQRGREGWELVSVNPSSSSSETCYQLIFKRESPLAHDAP